jgi:transposase
MTNANLPARISAKRALLSGQSCRRYKTDRKVRRTFRPHSSIAYDDRILRFKPGDQVSIWTLNGRQVMPFVCGDYQRRYLPLRKGEVDLVFYQGTFYLNVVCDVEELPTTKAGDILGADLGVVNIATDSDGITYTGATVEQKRRIDAHRRWNPSGKARALPNGSRANSAASNGAFNAMSTTSSARQSWPQRNAPDAGLLSKT